MSVLRWLTGAVRTSAHGAGAVADGLSRTGRFLIRQVSVVRERSAAGEIGMVRLLDLHVASCAGDALIAIGLAGTIFFSVPVGEARDRVALYLLVTMVPFALLAPVVGPLLDRFRHGRRYALATTMLGRGFLAWVISDNLGGLALYPAAFGVLTLSRAYGVARAAAVPRLIPESLGLVEAGARGSLFGTVAGALAAPVGIALVWFGPQWALRLASVVFLYGMVVALRLPPRADSDPPEVAPRAFHLPGLRSGKVLTGKLVWTALVGGVALRAMYGFLALFLAFRIREGDFPLLRPEVALSVVAVALGAGSFLATALCARARFRRPLLPQTIGMAVIAAFAALATWWYTLGTVALLCLATSFVAGFGKLAIDAIIQERLKEQVRASAFAHSETLLMLAWVAGGALGLAPLSGRLGLLVATIGVIAVLAQLTTWASQLRDERLTGVVLPSSSPAPSAPEEDVSAQPSDTAGAEAVSRRTVRRRRDTKPTHPEPDVPGSKPAPPPSPERVTASGTTLPREPEHWERTRELPGAVVHPDENPTVPLSSFEGRTVRIPPAVEPGQPAPPQFTESTDEQTAPSPPGYHLYRPSGRGGPRGKTTS